MRCISTTKSVFIIILAIAVLLALTTCTKKPTGADLMLINGKVVTMDDNLSEAEAIAIKDGKILAVGNSAGMQAYQDEHTIIIDLDGRLAIPGFIDGHAHFMGVGKAAMRLKLQKAENWDDVIAMVESAVASAKPGEWILGRGWHQDKWNKPPMPSIDGLPHHKTISEISPNNPVYLRHASGHSAFANQKAMELAGIDRNTENTIGGEIVRDRSGNPIGIFRENAMLRLDNALQKHMDTRTPEQIENNRRKVLIKATDECLSNGITSFHDAGVSFETIEYYKKLADDDKLGVRLYVMISENNDSLRNRLSDYKIIGAGDNHLTVRSIKRIIDGALGSHGAWLLEPYDDLPSSTGLNTETIEDMKETARLAIENGFQFCTHAIGDRGNRETLDIYEEAFNSYPAKTDLRWRIEHAQHLNEKDIPRFGQLGVIAAMQGVHCTSDGPWVPSRIGDARAEEGAYVWQKLMQSGAIISNGTDSPVEDVDPIACFYATVTRRMNNGEQFYAQQAMSRMQALRSYTYNPAYSAFEEDIKGSLTPGKLADITVLSRDILTIPAEEILTTEVDYTFVGGKLMYRNRGRD
ncbi:MAG: amidohydrolase [candidate division Zixibacteria bacterium]|nr:amidohydrolase [candidate division Zixibacteria bacterium]